MVRVLRLEEIENWYDFAARVFDQPRSRFVRRWEGDPHRMRGAILVARDGDRIVSALRIFAREIYLGGLPVSVGGIGDLCTDEAYRGQGFASRLLQEAIYFMGQRAMAVSLLFAPDRTRFTSHGWKPVPMEMGLSDLEAEAKTTWPYELTPANPRDPAEGRQLQLIYEQVAPALQGAAVRADLAYWTGWLPGEWKRAVVARKGGRLAGYLAAEWSAPDELQVVDFAALPGEESLLFQASVRAMVREQGLGRVRVRYPLALPLDLGPVERYRNDAPMYRVIQPPLLPLRSAQALEAMLRGDGTGHLIWPADWF